MEKNRSLSIPELMWENMNQPIQEFLGPNDDHLHQHTRASQGRRVYDSYEEYGSTSILAQLEDMTNFIKSMLQQSTAQQVHLTAISYDYYGERHSYENCPYNVDAYIHMDGRSWNQQQNSSWYDQRAQCFFYHNNFAHAADML